MAPAWPTIHEPGLVNFDETGQRRIVIPEGINKDVLAKLYITIVTTMRTPEFVKRPAGDGSGAVANTLAEYRA